MEFLLAIGLFVLFIVLIMVFANSDTAKRWAKEAEEKDKKIVCPHCQTKGFVRTKPERVKTGISGSKATGAILTGGISVLATGLSKKEWMTEAHCSNCDSTWRF